MRYLKDYENGLLTLLLDCSLVKIMMMMMSDKFIHQGWKYNGWG